MTRRHFEQLAEAVRIEFAAEPALRARVARTLADYCAEQNGRFARDRFFNACGVTG